MTTIAKKVFLRPVEEKDYSLFKKWFGDLEVMKYVVSHMPKDIEYTKAMWLKDYSKKNAIVFIIEIDTKPIGICGFKNIDNEMNIATFVITIGEKEFWNQGYGTEIARLLIDYSFEELKLCQINSAVFGFNIRSKRMHEKLGFEIEAKKGNSPPTQDENRKLWDDIYFTIPKKDWDIKQKIARSNLR